MKRMSKHAIFAVALLTQAAVACAAPVPSSLQVASSSFADDSKMPAKLGCEGANLSPEIHLAATPAGTRSLAIVLDDPDAPVAFAHWLAYDIPADTRELPEGAATLSQRLEHAVEGTNSFGRIGYGGPCPPPGTTHHYVLHVYALDSQLALPAGANVQQLNAAIQNHVLAEGRITGAYTRSGR